MNDGTGRYHFKVEDHVDFMKYFLLALSATITISYFYIQKRHIKFLLGNDEQVWKEFYMALLDVKVTDSDSGR
jgi:hypothetical protein